MESLEHEPFPESVPPPERPVRRHRLLLWVLLIGGIATAAGFWLWWHSRNRESTDDATVDGHLVPVSARISGRVQQVLVDDNQFVKQGQTIVQLDPTDFQARVQEMQARLSAAIANARAAEAAVPLARGTTTSETSSAAANLAAAEEQARAARIEAEQAATSEVRAAEANVAQAEANNRKAQADLERMRPLAAKEEISRQQFDAFLAAAQVAEAQWNNARQQLISARQAAERAHAAAQAAVSKVNQARAQLRQSQAGQRQIQVTAAQAKSARAAIEQARANLHTALLNLSYTQITASVAGNVTNKQVEPGQFVQPGQALLSLVPLYNVWVTANFKETQLAHVRAGQRAEVHVDTYGKTIIGRVDSIAGATGAITSLLPPENATGNFVKVVQRIPVKIVFDCIPPGIVLRPGMNVEATIITE
jgi:membrane fusion protein (multidrug efflux system)